MEISAGYYQVDGGLAASHSLLPVPTDTLFSMPYSGAVEPPQVVVGPSNVLVAWNGIAAGNSNPRYALFDDSLNSALTPVVQLVNSYAPLITGAGLGADGNYYLELGHASGNLLQELIIVSSTTGAQLAVYTLPNDSLGTLVHPQGLGVDSTYATQSLPLGPGFFFVTNEWPNYDIGYLAFANDGGFVTTQVAMSSTPRSRFTLLPMTATTVGMVWTDGELKRTILECKP